ncbi:hypothetical protein LBMAG53_16700 [Planctomycetota bacterium]|nr:hypothetical protein LBMAG53_16700 [Planctomycetota bacterium]
MQTMTNPPDQLLSDAQKRFFATFGYLHLPGILADLIPEVIAGFERIWAAHGGGHDGKPHDGQARSCLPQFLELDPQMCMLLDDARIRGLLVSLLGEDFQYMGSDGNYYVGDTGWHQDGGDIGITQIKIAFYLDPLDAGNGALRVIPGSHLPGGFDDQLKGKFKDSVESLGVTGSQVPAVALATVPGDLAVFDHRLRHSSWNGSKRRRMFTMNSCGRWPDHRLGDLQEYIAGGARFLVDSAIAPTMREVATPRMRRHLEQAMNNDGLMRQRVAELRAKGTQAAARG